MGQRNGLQLSDIILSTDPRNDFAGLGLAPQQVSAITDPITNGFVLNRGGPIYVPTGSILYQNSVGNTEFQDFGGAVLRHEQVHAHGDGEFRAYTVQRDVLQFFKNDFQAGHFKDLDEQLQRSIERHQAE